MLKIIDASVAIKWFVKEEGREGALAILDLIEKKPEAFAVPELFFNEMLSVLYRLTKDYRIVQTHLSSLESLGLQRIGNGHEILSKAAEIACQYELRDYDSVYAASAMLMGGRWLTADKEACQKIHGLGLAELC